MGRSLQKRVLLAGVTFFLASQQGAASAYTISNVLSTGCHEQISSQALRTVRLELANAGPLPLTNDEQAFVDDVQFTPDADMKDLGGATFLVSVRDNDLKGLSSSDLSALALVHGNPDGQEEHCLRAADQKEPGGSAAAVTACRAFIHQRAMEAIAGLDSAGKPDLNNRTVLTLYLSIRGPADIPLPTYYVKIGQAIHAIEDSFTHTYRTADEMKITVVLDWLDLVNGTLVESRDGPGHATALDRCDDADAIRTTRHQLAIDASAAILRGTLDPSKTAAEKLAAVDATLDKYLSYSPGCTFDNQWCNAPEAQYKNPQGCGCRVGGGAGRDAAAVGFAMAALLLAAIARRGKRAAAARVLGFVVVGTVTLTAAQAGADPQVGASRPDAGVATTTTTTTKQPAQPATPGSPAKPPETVTTTTEGPTTATTVVTPATTTTTVTGPTDPSKSPLPPPTIVPVTQPGPIDPSRTAIGAYAGFSGSIDRAAIATTLGARLRASKHWTFGLDGEWNPWLAFTGSTVRAGVANLYGTAMLRIPLAYEDFNLRTSVSVGASYLLSNFYGAPSGTVGVYAGVSLLALEYKLSRVFYLILNPNIALPVPQLSGVPFLYPQYRFTIGLEGYGG